MTGTSADRSVSRRAWLLFGAMCVIWGIPYLLIRVAVREVSPEFLVLARTGLAALLLVPIAAMRGELRPLLRHKTALLVFTAVEIAVPWFFLSSAEQHLSSSLAGLLIAAVPLVGAVVVVWATGGRDRFDRIGVVGLLVGFAGVAAIVGVDVGAAGARPLLEMAVVVVGYAVGPIILARYLGEAPALGVIAASLALTAVIYAPIAAFSLPSTMPAGRVVASVVALALVCTAFAFLLFFALIGEIGPVRATVITYVNPAVAAVLGVTILDERFTVSMGVGFALVLVGSVLATRRGSAAARSVPQAAEAGGAATALADR
jgi:drug/metabolite transporter (DMT)-like permease